VAALVKAAVDDEEERLPSLHSSRPACAGAEGESVHGQNLFPGAFDQSPPARVVTVVMP